MKVYEINIRTYLKRDLKRDEIQEKISLLITDYMGKNEKFNNLHQSRGFKPYCHSNLTPICSTYKKDNLYNFIIRTIDEDFLTYLLNGFDKFENNYFKNIFVKSKIINKHMIKELYTINPVIIKNHEKGYWRNCEDVDFFEQRLNKNIINKYNQFNDKNISYKDNFYSVLDIVNEYAIITEYKGVKLLGDKIRLTLNLDEQSQDLAYLAIGVGLLENNSIGNGFVAYTYL